MLKMKYDRLNRTFSQFILYQFREFWGYYLGALIALFLTHRTQSELPFLAKNLADQLQAGNVHIKFWPFPLIAIGIIVFRTMSRLLFFYPARILQKYLRLELLERLENAPPERYRHLNSGQLFQLMTNDLDSLRALIGFVFMQLGNVFMAFIVLIPRLFKFSPQMVYALLPLVVVFIVFSYVVSRNRHFMKEGQRMQGELQNFVMETYVGKKTINNFSAEDVFVANFEKLSLKELYYFFRTGLNISFSMPLMQLGVGLSLICGAWLIKLYSLPVSTLILFSGFIFLFLEPLMYLSWMGMVLTQSHASWKRIKELLASLDQTTHLESQLDQLNQNEKFPQIRLPFWDQSLDIVIENNQWIALVGHTGSGKSELLQKLCLSLKQKNKNISYVSQEPYLYNDSVEKNIFLGHLPNEEELKLAKELLVLFELNVIEPDLNKLLHLQVGENGKRLSGGQIKRVCLIRSMLSTSEIVVWDDPFSSVDLILEKEIINKLKAFNLFENKCLIYSTHRLSTFRLSDQYYLVSREQGLLEQGLTKKLLTTNSKVYEFFKEQMV